MLIREAREDDAIAISGLYQQLVQHVRVNVLPVQIEKIRSSADNFLLVCEQEDRVCGVAQLTLCMDAMFGVQSYAVIENVIVDESCRGRGIGGNLFLHIEALCVRADCSKIMLLSSLERTGAHEFFTKIGFKSGHKIGFVKYRSQFQRNSI